MNDTGGTSDWPGSAAPEDPAFIAQVPEWVLSQEQQVAQEGQPQSPPTGLDPSTSAPAAPPPPWRGEAQPPVQPEPDAPPWGPAQSASPAQAWGQPVQPEGTPVQAWGQPVQPEGTPGQAWGQPAGAPAQPWGQPAQSWGQSRWQSSEPAEAPAPASAVPPSSWAPTEQPAAWSPTGTDPAVESAPPAYAADGRTVVRAWNASPGFGAADPGDQTLAAAGPYAAAAPPAPPWHPSNPAHPGAPVPPALPTDPSAAAGGRPRWLIPAAAGVAVLAVLGLVFALVVRPRLSGDNSASGPVAAPSPSTSTPVVPKPTTPAATATPPPTTNPADVQAQALLGALRHKELQDKPPKGQWVAVLAVRYPGIPDPTGAKTPSGSPVFMPSTILEEYKKIVGVATPGVDYGLLLTTDYAPKTTNSGKSGWVTYAFGPFTSAATVTTYCQKRFPTLKGPALTAACAPTQLNP